MFSKLKHFDLPLLVTTFLLIVSGLALLYGTTTASENSGVFFRQLLFSAIGLIGFFFMAFVDYHALSKQNRIAYLLLIAVLLYLLLFGNEVRGGRRWIDLFGAATFQPAEFVKIAVIFGLARLLYMRRGQINDWKILLWSAAYAGVPILLVLLQPDLGSALVAAGIWAGMIFVSPISKKIILGLVLGGLVLCAGTWQFVLKDFQKDRIRVFLNPDLDPRGRGYNVKQSSIAIGSGKMWGRGLGAGLQSQNRFLPERQTDFIFAAGSEQIGFFGTVGVLCLFFFSAFRMLKIARRARDDLGMYICCGVFFLFCIHTLVNVGMNMGLLPVTGIPLPFFSAGGSGLIVILLAFGIVQSVAVRSKILRF